jgi:Na+/H+ antiporter NhaD/arsenite permease-like protein
MDPKTLEIITAAVFVITYLLMIWQYRRKAWIIWGGVAAIFLAGAVTFDTAWKAINWDVIGIYVGMLFIAEALVHSKVPDYIAIWMVNRSKKVWVAMIAVCVLTGFLSVVIENVACVLIVAPIIFAIAKKVNVSPVPMIIGAAVSSNLQGVATLIGDPPSMLLASHAGLTFNDFFFFQGKAGLFFAVQLGMIASLSVLYWFFRNHNHDVHYFKEVEIRGMFPAVILVAMIGALAAGSSMKAKVNYSPGITCLLFGFASLAWLLVEKKRDEKSLFRAISNFDWGTGMFIIAVFILVDSLTQTGLIADLAQFIFGLTGNDLFSAFLLVTGMSVLLSAFIDNVPYIVAMLPVTQLVAQHAGVSPYVLYFGLLIGTSVGGNITPIGASANIVGVGLLKNKGYETGFWEFMKIGLPFTIVAVLVSAGYIWLVFG